MKQYEWENGWQGHELAQLKRMSKLSLFEKIQWLSEAQDRVTFMKGKIPKDT